MFHGQFIVQRQLGVALFGDVWLCLDVCDDNRPVAIKEVHLGLARRALTNNFLIDNPWTERRTLATIMAVGSHENVIETRQQFQQDDSWFVVMEFCDGGDLWQQLEQTPHHRLPEARALPLFTQIISGLIHLHTNGIAHRDLSLENVLLSNGICKICDFGLSTKADRICQERVGKGYYMAPEVVAGENYDPRAADIWSMGIVLFVMLTGSPLISIASVEEKAYNALTKVGVGVILDAWGMSDLVSLRTKHLLLGMLQINPAVRFTVEDIMSSSDPEDPV
ncbi:hypothetical protein BBO99_00009386 [Phytophthora kernoviae]|uniref:Protein kinase domain-containing protein n=2 Tax=Phytophthora kernoviae TaxID=325452 RepID=A0A421EW26_9STRA|nr:hypothetical protein G195_011197 [Phytophthora kernoviae 00238/432]KAG2502892.1 hypothetical protein JM16_009360 [Phytophthora kernoviae]RLN06068.1 hypothetical protein BBI17_009412 [Phytophthora kernoviae]RLN73496.1 hypothetical protein BBO99_00009386 [Phytophthora kernoviae]